MKLGTVVRWHDQDVVLGKTVSEVECDGVECFVAVKTLNGSIITACVGHLVELKPYPASKAAAVIRCLGMRGYLDPRFLSSVTERIVR